MSCEMKAGYCLKPKNFSRLPFLASPRKFMAPGRVDCRDYLGPTENQREKPWCSAYAAANWAEAMLWRKNDYYEQISPSWIYEYAKNVDGMPEQEGTSLTAALEALRGSVFDRDVCKVKVIRATQNSFRYAIHKFGLVVAGFNISETWYGCTSKNPVISDIGNEVIGGHACVVAGYDNDGVFIQNSWGAKEWGNYGFGKLTWEVFDKQIVYGAILSNVLDGLTINT